MSLEKATEKVVKLATNNSGKVNAKINFKFDEGMIHLDDTVTPTVVSNEELEAECTIKLSLENFLNMMHGDLNPMMAMMSGKMKIEGSKGVAMKLAALF